MSIKPRIGLLLVILIISIPIFSRLDTLSIRIWDEGRLANSAVEMYQTGNPLVVTYGFEPEMWSTKHPLLIWLQVLSLKIFGLNDLAFRMPTALSAVFTCLFLYWFAVKKIKSPWIGILSALVLTTCPGYVMIHGIRTGDYDATLVFFTTLYTIFFFLFLEEERKKYFWLTITFMICAVLTKGVAGVLFLPGLLIYIIYKKKITSVTKMPQLYLGVFVFLFFTVGYYLLREQYNPGYIDAVMENELGGRFSKTLEGHSYNRMYYFSYLGGEGFKPWYILCLMGIVLGVVSKEKFIRDITVFILITCLSFLVVISMGETKLYWYTMPMYPLMAISVAVFIYTVACILNNTEWWKQYLSRNLLPYVFMLLLCIGPYIDMQKYVLEVRDPGHGEDDMSNVFKKVMTDGYPYSTKMTAIFFDYQSGLEWYLKVFNLRNVPITKSMEVWGLENEQLAITYNDGVKKLIEENYEAHVVSQENNVTIYQIHGKKH